MKTSNRMKHLLLLSFLAFGSIESIVSADEIKIPVISSPLGLEEGTQRTLTEAQIAELLPWAKDSKMFLSDLLENIQGLSIEDKIDRLREGMMSVVGESAPKHSELLMRYSINRGLSIFEILNREVQNTAVGSADAKLRVLRSSILMALKYYEIDMNILSKKSEAPFVLFGMDYFEFLTGLNKSIFDASAQYAIQRSALEWLQWDLYRDLHNISYAPQIVKINNSLKTFPNKKLTDAQSIAFIRQMKKVGQQMAIPETLVKIEEERRLSAASNDNDRLKIKKQIAQEKAQKEKEALVESMRGQRSDILIEKVFSLTTVLESNSWVSRRDAVLSINEVVGGDVTLILIERLIAESDTDVSSALGNALKDRVGKIKFLLKSENFNTHYDKIIKLLNSKGMPRSWTARVSLASSLGQTSSTEIYKMMAEWLTDESDSDVQNSLREALKQIEENMRNK
jgi:hypothetical protein